MIIPHRCCLQSQKSCADMVKMIKKVKFPTEMFQNPLKKKRLPGVLTRVLKMKKIIAVISNEPKAVGFGLNTVEFKLILVGI